MENHELYHYGVKGMKWGVRRTAAQLGHLAKKGAKKATVKFDESLAKRAAQLGHLAKKGTKKAKVKFDESRAKRAAKKLRKKPLKDLTDEELNARLKRLTLEKQVSDLQKQMSTISIGKQFISKAAKDVLVPAAVNASREVIERWLKKQGYVLAGLKDTQYGISALEKEANEARLRKETASNNKQAEVLDDWFKERKATQERKAAEERAEKDINDRVRKAEQKAEKSAKNSKNAKTGADKVFTGTVTGEGTSKRQNDKQKKPKSNDYYDPIYTDFVNNKTPVTSLVRTDSYRTGNEYVKRLLLNP